MAALGAGLRLPFKSILEPGAPRKETLNTPDPPVTGEKKIKICFRDPGKGDTAGSTCFHSYRPLTFCYQ